MDEAQHNSAVLANGTSQDGTEIARTIRPSALSQTLSLKSVLKARKKSPYGSLGDHKQPTAQTKRVRIKTPQPYRQSRSASGHMQDRRWIAKKICSGRRPHSSSPTQRTDPSSSLELLPSSSASTSSGTSSEGSTPDPDPDTPPSQPELFKLHKRWNTFDFTILQESHFDERELLRFNTCSKKEEVEIQLATIAHERAAVGDEEACVRRVYASKFACAREARKKRAVKNANSNVGGAPLAIKGVEGWADAFERVARVVNVHTRTLTRVDGAPSDLSECTSKGTGQADVLTSSLFSPSAAAGIAVAIANLTPPIPLPLPPPPTSALAAHLSSARTQIQPKTLREFLSDFCHPPLAHLCSSFFAYGCRDVAMLRVVAALDDSDDGSGVVGADGDSEGNASTRNSGNWIDGFIDGVEKHYVASGVGREVGSVAVQARSDGMGVGAVGETGVMVMELGLSEQERRALKRGIRRLCEGCR